MSTVAATHSHAQPDLESSPLSGKAHFYLRRLHSLTGLLFGGYLIVHLLVNATLVEGMRERTTDVYQAQVNKIHELPFLTLVEYSMIILPLAFHTLYGLYVTFNGRPNTGSYGYGKNYLYVAQRVSALIIFAFAFFHVVTMKGGMNWAGDFWQKLTFLPENATQSAINHMHSSAFVGWVIYPVGILASTFHLANGFWTGAITWGLTISKQAQQRFGYLCAGLFVLMTICGFLALGTTLAKDPNWNLVGKQAQTERPAKGEMR